jgi:glycosyltransferase involved in cell wall biosynthesis
VVVYTCPHGPFAELVGRLTPHYRGHVHHFTHSDLSAVFGTKADWHVNYFSSQARTPRGHVCANWIIRYRVQPGRPTQPRDYAQVLGRTRPKPRLSVGIITFNAEADILKCLTSIWYAADEIVIGDTGSTDRTKEVARAFDVYGRKVRIIDIPSVSEDPDGFAGARNRVLQASTGDWFLWIDADETLVGAEGLWKYLEHDGGVYTGFVLRQNHLQLDCPNSFDRPVRLFRRRPDIQFYGCIHEQPQMGDCNGDILPTLEILDVQIAHTGYLTEGVRLWKMRARNLPLLEKDAQRFPDRQLGWVLVMRDLVNLGDMSHDATTGLTPEAKTYYSQAVGLWERMKDPAHRYHVLARPFYERAIRWTQSAMEIEIAIAGKAHGMGEAHAKPERIWVRGYDELKAYLDHKLATDFQAKLEPTPLDLEPIPPAPQAEGVAA